MDMQQLPIRHLLVFFLYVTFTVVAGQKILPWKIKSVSVIVMTILTTATAIGFYQIRIVADGVLGYWPAIIFVLIWYVIVGFFILRLAGLNPVQLFTTMHH